MLGVAGYYGVIGDIGDIMEAGPIGNREELLPVKYRRSIRDAAVLALLAALVLVVVVALVRGPKFKLEAIDPESIPAEVREWALASPDRTDIVWRGFHEEPGYYVSAVTYSWHSPARGAIQAGYSVGLYTLDADGKYIAEGHHGSSLGPWVFGGGGGHSPAEGRYDFYAQGIAFHPQAARVVGSTSTGREVECRVVNGFWGLLVIDAKPYEWWTSVNAVDADGLVLFRYWDGERWHAG